MCLGGPKCVLSVAAGSWAKKYKLSQNKLGAAYQLNCLLVGATDMICKFLYTYIYIYVNGKHLQKTQNELEKQTRTSKVQFNRANVN